MYNLGRWDASAILKAFVCALFALFASVLAAQAQSYDRLVEITDTVEGVVYDPSPAGGTIEHLFEVINDGPDAAPAGSFLEIVVPANTSLLATRGDLTCTPDANGGGPVNGPAVVQCAVPEIANGDQVEVIATFDAPLQTVIIVEARIPDANDSEQDNSNPTAFVIEERTTIEAGSDLSLTLDLPDRAASGEVVPFTYTVLNNGPDPSTSSTFEVPLPNGFENIVVPAGCVVSGSVATCSVGALAVNEDASFTFTGQVGVGTDSTIVATGAISSAVPGDAIETNNSDTGTLTVDPGSDVTVDLTRSPGGTVLVGEEVTFTVAPSYSGEEPSDLSFTFDVPPGMEVTETPTPADWACVVSGAVGAQTVTCTRPDGGGAGTGVDVSLGTIEIVTEAIADGDQTASVTITAATPDDSDPNNNTAEVTVPVVAPEVDLDVRKRGPFPAVALVGDSVNYRLDAQNTGNADFVGTTIVSDSFPAGLTLTSLDVPTGTTCTVGGSAITLPLVGPATIECARDYDAGDPLSAGERLPEVTTTFDVTSEGILRNTARVSIENAPGFVDSDPSNDTQTFDLSTRTGGNATDARVEKTDDSAGAVDVGSIQTFSITLINDGPVDIPLQPSGAEGLRLTDRFTSLLNTNTTGADAGIAAIRVIDPDGAADFQSNGPFSNGCTLGSRSGNDVTMTCRVNTLEVCGGTGEPACPIVEVDIRPGLDGTSRTNTATVQVRSIPETNPDNNNVTIPYEVNERADITVEKSVAPSNPRAGQTAVFTIDVSNRPGYSTAQNVELVDTLPAGLRIDNIETPGSATCVTTVVGNAVTTATDTITCDIGTLNQNQQQSIIVSATPIFDTTGQTLTNRADVTTTTTEVDLNNNDASADITIQDATLDLLVNKIDDADPVVIGDQVTYTITVENRGPSDSENVQAIDRLPPDLLQFDGVTASDGGVCTTSDTTVPADGTIDEVICEWALVEDGQTRTMDITMTALAKGTARNEVEISSREIAAEVVGGPELEGPEANNVASDNTTIKTRTELAAVSKTALAADGTTVIAEVDPEEDFFFDLVFEVQNGPGLREADEVMLIDLLPDGVTLRSLPAAATVTGGTIEQQLCTTANVSGRTQLTCDFGTVQPVPLTGDAGDPPVQVTLRLPVEIASGTDGSTFDNSFSVTTTSVDQNPDNNTESESVSLVTSSIAGEVWRDFDDDGTQDTGDTNVAGVDIRLTGTTLDGEEVNILQTTGSDGSYLFEDLAPGTYTVTREPVDDENLADGRAVQGTGDGTVNGPTLIETITLPADTDLVDYDFTLIPTARIGIAKQVVGTPSTNIDGSFDTTFRLLVENFSEEPLINIEVTDELAGAAPLFGTNVSATDGTPGQYAITQPPSGTCGGNDAGFNGVGDDVVATGFGLGVGATCTIDFTVRTQPTVPLPDILASGGRYENQAVVDGEGELSGQTSDTNTELTDLSDDGAEPDANDDGDGSDAGENDPTPVIPDFSPGIALIKTADTSALSANPQEDEVITYSFAVTNTGNVTLTDITIVENLIGAVVSGSIASLDPGQTDTDSITATYEITQDDIDAGEVENSATVTGTDPFDNDVTDDSGTTNTDDNPLVTPLVQTPGISLIKTASDLPDTPQVGDEITYSFEIQNTGNVRLTDVTITDDLDGIVLVGDPIPSMEPGDINTDAYTATYALTADDIEAGEVINDALVTGTPPDGPDQTDPGSVTTPINQVPGLETTKTQVFVDNGDGVQGIGDTLNYTITVENIGNIPVSGLGLVDTLTDLDSNVLALSDGPDFDSASLSSPEGTLLPGEVATYLASYTADVDAVNTGGVDNTVTATGTPDFGPEPTVDDVSDDGIDDDGNTTDDPTEFRFEPPVLNPGLDNGVTLTKTTTSSVVARGDIVPYEITVTNENPFLFGPVDLVDTLPPGFLYVPDSASLPGAISTGRRITWPDILIPATGSLTITLEARILNGARSGNLTNVVELFNAGTNDPVAPPAEATVRILPEAVFDCSEVIGKVYEDHNGNGRQDPDAGGGITDQDIFNGKFGGKASPVISPQDLVEEGVPNARIATVDGTIITTDANGLFSVPCASLPEDGGSNFILKLDERSLPAGWRVTTENPRVMRLTPGMMSEMNFGVALSRVVRIDLGPAAFPGGELSPALTQGIANLLPQIATEVATLRLAYVVAADAGQAEVRNARAALNMVERHIRREWRDVGERRLLIEQVIRRLGQ
ncbi:MAG: SdrD B-like domain-containing protein [Pseudomonadota bacterium]